MNFFKITSLALGLVLAMSSSYVATASATTMTVSVTKYSSTPNFKLGIGSELTLQLGDKEPVPGLFLGTSTEPSGIASHFLFLDLNKTRIYLVDPADTRWTNATLATKALAKSQPIINPYEQIGGTCASYGMFHYFLQLNLSKTLTTPHLEEKLSVEEGRTQLLALAMDSYYIERPNGTSIKAVMKNIGKTYDLTCNHKIFETSTQAISFIKKNLAAGSPVLVAFDIGNEMVNSSYEITNFEDLSRQDGRLWVPRKRGQRNSGGHTLVLAAGFYNGSRYKTVTLDSDWNDPRIWDIANYINPKTVMKEMEFVTCH